MSDTQLRDVLLALKNGAKEKRYGEKPQGFELCRGFLFTCVVENGRMVLGISLDLDVRDKDRASSSEVIDAVVAVFGEPPATFQAEYPGRGMTTLYSWPVR